MTETIEGVVQRYLDHLQLRNLRHWTIYNRHRALARLSQWAGGPVLYLTEADLKRWQEQRATEIQSEPLRTDTSHLRQFYRWALREGFIDSDPTLRLEMPKVRRRLPRPIRDQHLADAIAAADIWTAAILGLASFAGLRACEIGMLDWADIDLYEPEPQVRIEEGKGGHGRRVPLSAALRSILLALPARRGPVIVRLDGNLGPCGAHRISSRANLFLHDLGIVETLHQCRHRFATVTYQACKDLRAVQELLGHQSPTTTAIYTKSASAVAVAAVESAGSLAA